jgi:putative ABC transport system permease protein
MRRPPLLARLLLRALLFGTRGGFVRAALEDEYDERVELDQFDPDGWFMRQAIGSVAAWWRWSAVRERWRSSTGGPAAVGFHTQSFWGGMMGSLFRDVSYALRGLRKHPSFVFVVIVTLGLGIGAVTTIFSVVDGVLLQPLAYQDSHELVNVGTTPGDMYSAALTDDSETYRMMGSNIANFLDWEARTRSFEGMAAVERSGLQVRGADGPEVISTSKVSDNFFEIFALSPALGRFFDETEYANGARVAVLSHGAWQRRFGADPNILGQPLRAVSTDGFGGERVETPWLIIGVLHEDFVGPEAMYLGGTEVWVPLDTSDPRYTDRGGRSANIVGRLADGVTVQTARTEIWRVMQQVLEEHPEGNGSEQRGWFGAGINTLHQSTVGDIGPTFMILLGSVGFLLLIACANVANLFMARGVDRVRELSLRMALGAGRLRVARQLMTESVVLGLLGGALGIVLSYGGVAAFIAFAPGGLPRTAEVNVDVRVLAFALVISVVTGVLFGLGPALQLTRGKVGDAIRTRTHGEGPGSSKLLGALVSMEIALALILTIGGGLLFNSFVRLRNVDPGFDASGIMTMSVRVPGGFEDVEGVEAFWRNLDRALKAVPGVESVGLGSNIPTQNPNWMANVLVPGEEEGDPGRGVHSFVVAPGFFETLRVSIVRGRSFTEADQLGGTQVVVVNQAFVDEHLKGSGGIGEFIRLAAVDAEGKSSFEIVGVMQSFRQEHTDALPEPAFFVPYTQATWPRINILARGQGNPMDLVDSLKRAIWQVNPDLAITGVRTLDARLSNFLIRPRFFAMLIGTFSIVALMIAAAGVYGTMSYTVGRRTRELGIRLALGASRSEVRSMVLRRGMVSTVVGVIVGLAGAYGLSRFLSDLLFDIVPTDPMTFFSVTATLIVVATLASYVPAQRATRVDPLEAIKAE